jgi:hypothetical protein
MRRHMGCGYYAYVSATLLAIVRGCTPSELAVDLPGGTPSAAATVLQGEPRFEADGTHFDAPLPPVPIPTSAASCPPELLRQSPPDLFRHLVSNASARWVSTNHKTGTQLSFCLRAVLARSGVALNLSSIHVSGQAGSFSPRAHQLNFVRNPFVLVHSGYEYHKHSKAERWLLVPLANMTAGTEDDGASWRRLERTLDGRRQGAYTALTVLTTCALNRSNPGTPTDKQHPHEPAINNSTTYQQALKQLSRSDGLLLESIRALHRDIPYMLGSARACVDVSMSNVTTDQTREEVPGACTNVWLEDVTSDFGGAFERIIAPALHIGGSTLRTKLARHFAKVCNLSADTIYALHAPSVQHSSHYSVCCTGVQPARERLHIPVGARQRLLHGAQ